MVNSIMIHLLVYTVGIPVLAGIVCLSISDKIKILAKLISLIITLAVFAATVFIFIRQPLYWPPVQNPTFIADSLSSLAGGGIAFFALLVTIYSFGFIEKNNGRYFGYVLMTLGCALGAVYANNLIMLVVFWGLLAALLYLLVSIDGTVSASVSAKKALIIIGGTDALLIFAIGVIWKMKGTFLIDGTHIELDGVLPWLAYLFIAFAAFAKAGAIPFHSWLPDVAEDGPSPVTAYLPASVDKLLGIYLLAKASLSLFVMNAFSNTFLLAIGAVTVVFAVAMALLQRNFKRLLGYHAVSQVGYMLLGIGTATPVGIAGGLFHMINHAVYKSCLFLSGGAVEKRMHTADMSKLGGIARYMPLTFTCFIIASLSISGIPPFNGFVSKWMVYQGIVETGAANDPLWIVWLIAAMFGGAITVANSMRLIHTIFLGKPDAAVTNIKEIGVSMALPMVILASICVIFGVFAFIIPIPLFILPAMNVESITYLGIWQPGIATILILVGIVIGFIMYKLIFPRKARIAGTFVGGEDPGIFDRVTGGEFYETIRDVRPLGRIYTKEENRDFDIYNIGERVIGVFTRIFQRLHNGILPTYLVWCLLGMVVMFIILFVR